MKLLAIGKDDAKMRLDRWLKVHFKRPQSFFQRHLREKRIVLVDVLDNTKHKANASYTLMADAKWRIGIQEHLYAELTADVVPAPAPTSSLPPLPVLYEDDVLIAVFKPTQLATQLGSKTLDSVASRYPQCKLVHRLDKGTSGVLLLAKTRLAAAELAEMFRTEQVCKTYLAHVTWPVVGDLAADGVIDHPLESKPARTTYRLRKRFGRTALLELQPSTGRKHQLRRHCAEVLGAPIVGDRRYGGATSTRMWLHAMRVQFLHPRTKRQVTIEAPLRTAPSHTAGTSTTRTRGLT
ncbi:hypothetical protein SPRG_00351 [Saprolegnia parasitica CBS 223.65]|uniref:Pseudouridine synthase RsuA/RluA-like domain-containing protein n=1 Tax=Saprolegnia parasitica (strain CBS 223.65) TaxID=695850 RepID=A0A067CXR7_SAPPC|nr:hypothetical protein SPRG_00351 [Saprolegnia parasitica CBS 223.65]KDO35504.1 hypothetical protein SPRG_00351 [Saprolegnia parasitica CBS 223.65]|eukprot:XP_012193841.1 hypothetical protein SPRG_00351 [Saprolegnia parasitica CBS 223.65]